jgi:hypothetical protein
MARDPDDCPFNVKDYPYVSPELWISSTGDRFWVSRATQSVYAWVDGERALLNPGTAYLPHTNSNTDFFSFDETYYRSNGFVSIGNESVTEYVITGHGDITSHLQDVAVKAAGDGAVVRIIGGQNLIVSSPIVVNSNNFTVLGDGRQISTITSTHSGAVFTTDSLTTDKLSWTFNNLQFIGPGSSVSGSTAIDLTGLSTCTLINVRASGYDKAYRIRSDGSGGRYNRFYNVEASSSNVGYSIEGDKSNANLFVSCRANVCDIGLFINNGNQNVWLLGEIEGSTTRAVHITATGNPSIRTEQNAIIASRFENNNQCWQIESNVLDTLILGPRVVGGSAVPVANIDNGSRTNLIGLSGSLSQSNYQQVSSSQNSVNGSWRFERPESAGSNNPLIHVRDSFGTSGQPLVIQASAARDGTLFRGLGTSNQRVWEVTTDGAMNILETSTAQSNPPANAAKIYVKDNGSNKTQIIARFADGSEVVLAVQP